MNSTTGEANTRFELHRYIIDQLLTQDGPEAFCAIVENIDPPKLLDALHNNIPLIRELLERNLKFKEWFSTIVDLVDLSTKFQVFFLTCRADIAWSNIIDLILERNGKCREWLEGIEDLEDLDDETRLRVVGYAMDFSRCDLIQKWCKPGKKCRPSRDGDLGCWLSRFRCYTDWKPLLPVLPLLLECEEPSDDVLIEMFNHPPIIPANDFWAYLVLTITKRGSLVNCTTAKTSIECFRFFAENVGPHLVEDPELILRDLIKGPVDKEKLELMCPNPDLVRTRLGTVRELLDAKLTPVSKLPCFSDDYRANLDIIKNASVQILRSLAVSKLSIPSKLKSEIIRSLESQTELPTS